MCGPVVLLLLVLLNTISACENVYYQGVPDSDISLIIKKHNDYRTKICRGEVPKQPKGKAFLSVVYDSKLAVSAAAVSDRCIFSHYIVPDTRWKSLGQNMYKEFSSKNTTTRNWDKAITAWYNEYSHYEYGVGSTNTSSVAHYTQVIWSTSTLIGCDYVYFKNETDKVRPFTKMYTCNYGPPGNVKGRLPYIEDKDKTAKC